MVERLAHLAAGVAALTAITTLAALHVSIPDVLTYAAMGLIGGSLGSLIPGKRAAASPEGSDAGATPEPTTAG